MAIDPGSRVMHVETSDIDEGAEIFDSTISPGVTIGDAWIDGSTIRQDAEIAHAAHIRNSHLGYRTQVELRSALVNCYVEGEVRIGQDCKLTGCFIQQGAVIGDNCQLTDTLVGSGCKVEEGVVTDDGPLHDALNPGDRNRLREWKLHRHGLHTYPDPGGSEYLRDIFRPPTESHNQRSVEIRPLYVNDRSRLRAALDHDEWIEHEHERRETLLEMGVPMTDANLPQWKKLGLIKRSSVGAGTRLLYGARIIGSDVPANSRIGEDAILANVEKEKLHGGGFSVHDGAHVTRSTLVTPAAIGMRAVVVNVRAFGAITFGANTTVGTFDDTTTVDGGARVGESTKVGGGVRLSGDCQVGNHCAIGDFATIGIKSELGDNVTLEARVHIASDVTIGKRSTIDVGAAVGSRATIGKRVTIGRDSVVEEGVQIGDDAEIAAAALVDQDVPEGGRVGGREAASIPAEIVIPVNANAEAWLYARLAEVAGPGKLTREKVKRERPELLEHPLTKELLRTQPKPVGPELIALSEGAKDATKYLVKIVPEGWTGLQRMGRSNNDVMRFQLSEPLLDELVGFAPETMHGVLEKEVLGYLQRHSVHETADDLTLGWVRFFTTAPNVENLGLVVVEEFQSDLPLLRWAMGKRIAQIDLDKAAPYATGRAREEVVPTLWTSRYATSRPFLVAAAQELDIDAALPVAGGTAHQGSADHIPQHDSTLTLRPSLARQEYLPGAESLAMATDLPRALHMVGDLVAQPWRYRPDEPEALAPATPAAWTIFLAVAAREAGDGWDLDPETITPEDVREFSDWEPEDFAAIDIHNKLMERAAVLFSEFQEARKQVWRNFVVQLHDLYETMLAFVLDWSAGRTQTADGEPAGPGFEVEHVVIPTHQMKERIEYAGKPPVYPYSKLYKRFQSASKTMMPTGIDTGHTGGDATVRLLRPNPSIWSEASW